MMSPDARRMWIFHKSGQWTNLSDPPPPARIIPDRRRAPKTDAPQPRTQLHAAINPAVGLINLATSFERPTSADNPPQDRRRPRGGRRPRSRPYWRVGVVRKASHSG